MFPNQISAIILVLLFIGHSKNAAAKRLEVGGSFTYKNISSAIAAANRGDEIFVHPGTYLEKNIEVKIPLTITGIKAPVVDAQQGGQIFLITHDSVTIRGLTIQNTGLSATHDFAGIRTQGANYVILEKNIFINCCYAVFLAGSKHCKVMENNITGSIANQQMAGNGIHAWQCSHIDILNNKIKQQRDGIYFEFVFYSTISGNMSSSNMRYGLHFMFSDANRFVQNLFEQNGAGVAVMYSKKITMLNNRYAFNTGPSAYGLLLKEINDSYVMYNYFEKNTAAIYMEGCNRGVILHNDFVQNGWALRIQASCDENNINLNNFSGNTFDVSTNGYNSLNNYAGNYWDKYEGYDLDKNGIGDIPFRPVSIFSMFSESVPVSMVMMRSFCVTLLDKIEQVVPGVIPENLADYSPVMKKNNNAYPGSVTQ